MNESPGIDLEPGVLLERLNPVDGGCNDGALVTMRTKDGSGKGGKAGLYAKCGEVLNDEFASLPVKCDPVKVKNKINFMQQHESAQR
jgi:hypothetical protein